MNQKAILILALITLIAGANAIIIDQGIKFSSDNSNVTYIINTTLTVDYVNITDDGNLNLEGSTINLASDKGTTVYIQEKPTPDTRQYEIWYNSTTGNNQTHKLGGLTPLSRAEFKETYWIEIPGKEAENTWYETTDFQGYIEFTTTPKIVTGPSGHQPRFQLTIHTDTCLTDNSSYNYNITFLNENNGGIYNFLENKTYWIDIICPNYGTDKITLSNTQTTFNWHTKEPPIFSVKIWGGEGIREQLMTNNTGRIYFYLPDAGIKYKFYLIDYTNEYLDSIMYVEKSVNTTIQTIHDNRWGGTLQKEMYITLQNNTPYRFKLVNNNGKIREYGWISLQPEDTTKNIEVKRIDLTSEYNNQYEGGVTLAIKKEYTTKTITLEYDKEEGTINTINMTIYMINQTPYYPIYTTQVTNTQTGTITYVVDNTTIPYWIKIIADNNGRKIEKAETIYMYNETQKIIDLNLPATGLFGIQKQTFYNLICLFIITITIIAFTHINAGWGGIIIVGEAAMLWKIGWLTFNPVGTSQNMVVSSMILSVLAIIALLIKLSERRYVE